ncbi:hypothetical protein ACTHPF_26680 [Paenibacillus sp. SAF-054]|uniref:hypothetical protein n=1 Tax=unclassified Paenibacillus TaxID=185978 RepID=UPI003F7FA086
MPKLDPEIKEHIDNLQEDEYINRSQGKVLKAYFETGSIKEGAAKLDMQESSFYSVINYLKLRKVLVKVSKGKYELNANVSEIEPVKHKIEAPPLPPLSITPEERNWMRENYGRYRHKRSEAAQILGRSKLDICRMAIALGIDQKISR